MRPLFTSSLKSKSSRGLVSFEATNKALILLTLVISLYCFVLLFIVVTFGLLLSAA